MGYKKTGYQKKYGFKTGNNKFDMCNMHLPRMMNMMPIYNPYTQNGSPQNYMPMPEMQGVPVQGAMPNMQMPFNPVVLPEFNSGSDDKALSEFLEVYLSLDNLNQDLYLRNRINE